VLWNGNRVRGRPEAFVTQRALADLILQPVAALGSTDPPRDTSVICEAVMGRMHYFLWERLTPSPADNEHLVRFCLAALTPAPQSTPTPARRRAPNPGKQKAMYGSDRPTE
jgi:hypothetical protein